MERNRTGDMALSAVLGLAAGALLVGPARRFAMQGAEAFTTRDWADALVMEHRHVQKTFDTLLATSDADVGQRKRMLATIDHALVKHTLQEEMVIYPALRRVDEQMSRRLYGDHAEVKSILSDLQYDIDPGNPAWIARARELRGMLEDHMREEEDEIFPLFRDRMSREENLALTRHMHTQGAMVS